jgi:hypothetical protein
LFKILCRYLLTKAFGSPRIEENASIQELCAAPTPDLQAIHRKFTIALAKGQLTNLKDVPDYEQIRGNVATGEAYIALFKQAAVNADRSEDALCCKHYNPIHFLSVLERG